MPLMVCGIVLYGMFKGVDVFSCFIDGAVTGLKTAFDIAPSLLALITAVTMLRTSGALDVVVLFLRPVSDFLGIPPEVFPMALLCPISGSGALGIYQNILDTFGTDNLIERTASIMVSSTETTFYATAVYYGAVGVKETRHTIPAALTADFTSFIFSAAIVKLMY